jgi:hypothetical protein
LFSLCSCGLSKSGLRLSGSRMRRLARFERGLPPRLSYRKYWFAPQANGRTNVKDDKGFRFRGGDRDVLGHPLAVVTKAVWEVTLAWSNRSAPLKGACVDPLSL